MGNSSCTILYFSPSLSPPPPLHTYNFHFIPSVCWADIFYATSNSKLHFSRCNSLDLHHQLWIQCISNPLQWYHEMKLKNYWWWWQWLQISAPPSPPFSFPDLKTTFPFFTKWKREKRLVQCLLLPDLCISTWLL